MATQGPIIVVDDDEDDHYLIKRVCEKIRLNSKVIFFVDGHQVLSYLKSDEPKPFIILSDINMPMMSGLELLKKINDDEVLRKKAIPFVFFSTAAMSSIVKESFQLEVQGFFIKEQTLTNLEKTLTSIFDYWDRSIRP